MEEGSLAVLVDAKTEYTQQFINIVKPCVYKSVHNLFIKSKESKYVLKKFQEELSQIPLWNQDIIEVFDLILLGIFSKHIWIS